MVAIWLQTSIRYLIKWTFYYIITKYTRVCSSCRNQHTWRKTAVLLTFFLLGCELIFFLLLLLLSRSSWKTNELTLIRLLRLLNWTKDEEKKEICYLKEISFQLLRKSIRSSILSNSLTSALVCSLCWDSIYLCVWMCGWETFSTNIRTKNSSHSQYNNYYSLFFLNKHGINYYYYPDFNMLHCYIVTQTVVLA